MSNPFGMIRPSAPPPPEATGNAQGPDGDLECPICLEIPFDSRIMQCRNGHLVCEPCHNRLSLCPVCRVDLARPGTRCLVAEQMVARMKVACPNLAHGCAFRVKGGDKAMGLHLAECHFR